MSEENILTEVPKTFDTREETETELDNLLRQLENYKGDKLTKANVKEAGNLTARIMFYLDELNKFTEDDK